MNRFVIQEHQATHLHWDFRLEKDGVLKSWAVPKSPPEQKGIKRLAVQVQDHEVSYIDFQGTIPEGQYGAGTVKIWDKGTYQIESGSPKRIVFELKGKRLKGRYALIHLKEKQWLLIKLK
jgi:bifunctional non-homologous end joining protein LigD